MVPLTRGLKKNVVEAISTRSRDAMMLLDDDEPTRIVVLMACIDEMHLATGRAVLSNEMCEEQARRWMAWLEPENIPIEDLVQSFVLGNSLRADQENPGPFGIADVARGFKLLQRHRAVRADIKRRLAEMDDRFPNADCTLCFGTTMWVKPPETDGAGAVIDPGGATRCPRCSPRR